MNLIKDHRPVEMAGLQTEGRNMKTVTSTTGQPLEELARQLVHTDLEMARYPDDQSDTDIVEEYMNRVSLYKGQHPWCHKTDIVLDILL